MMTFLDHLAELRRRILFCVLIVAAGAAVTHAFHEPLIELLTRPVEGRTLYFLSPLDPLFFVLKVDVFGGVLLALPVINWNILSFIRPAMSERGWLMALLLTCLVVLLTACGLAYAYFVMAPISLRFLLSIQVADIQSMITAGSYMNFLLTQSLIISFVFQIPIFIVAGVYAGVFTVRALAAKRRIVYVGGLIILAVVTPTADLFNLAIVMVPAAAIFEGSLLAARAVTWRRNRQA